MNSRISKLNNIYIVTDVYSKKSVCILAVALGRNYVWSGNECICKFSQKEFGWICTPDFFRSCVKHTEPCHSLSIDYGLNRGQRGRRCLSDGN